MHEHIGVVRRQGLELVLCASERQLGERGDLFGEQLGKPRLGIEAGAHRRSALRQRVETFRRFAHPRDAALDLRCVTGELLAKRQRCRVLGMGTADLDDLGEGIFFLTQRFQQHGQRGDQLVSDALGGGDMHRGWKRVVRRLAHIDVIVRMHRLLGAGLAAEQFAGTVGDHLIEVHVGLRTRSGLPDHQREIVVELAVDHFARRTNDGASAALVEQAEFKIGLCRRKLHDRQCANDRHRHELIANLEVMFRAFGLRAPVVVRRHFDRSERVGFGARCFLQSGHDAFPVRFGDAEV